MLIRIRKSPWRLSAPRKLRHRRRLRRVDNVVAVLDSALKRQAASFTQQALPSNRSPPSQIPRQPEHQHRGTGKATPEELSTTAEGQRLLNAEKNADLEARRHGRGPRQGEFVPEFTERGVQKPGEQLLSDQAQLQGTIKLIERWKAEMPTEQEMLPRDKYTMFDRKAKKYRKGIHKLPKWTRVSQRLNPPGF